MMRSIAPVPLVTVLACAAAYAQSPPPSLDRVVARLAAYAGQYGERLADVVAEERYEQRIDASGRRAPAPSRVDVGPRVLRSDYALVQPPGHPSWVGFRDTFDVDGSPVREREERLVRLLADGTRDGLAQAERIAAESARFNLGGNLFTRNINVPTLVLELLHPRHGWRFSFRKDGEEAVDGSLAWRIAYRERETPTLIRRPTREDQPVHGVVWVDPATGAARRTELSWARSPRGTIVVRYGRVPEIDVPVPLHMSEQYDLDGLTLTGDASYTDYRRFRTDGRLVTP